MYTFPHQSTFENLMHSSVPACSSPGYRHVWSRNHSSAGGGGGCCSALLRGWCEGGGRRWGKGWKGHSRQSYSIHWWEDYSWIQASVLFWYSILITPVFLMSLPPVPAETTPAIQSAATPISVSVAQPHTTMPIGVQACPQVSYNELCTVLHFIQNIP